MALRRSPITVNEYLEKYIRRREREELSEKTQKTTKPTHELETSQSDFANCFDILFSLASNF